MRIRILGLIVFASCSSFAQLKIATGEQLTVVNGGMLYANEAIVNNGTISLNAGRILLANNFNNAGIMNATNATIEMVGGNTQSLTFGANDIAKRVELNKSANTATVIAGNLTITDAFKSVAGTLDASEKMVLQSTSARTAIVDPSTGGTVNNMVVERYIPAKRAFRFLSSPVTTTSSIKYNWQENQNNVSPVYANNSNTASGYGTHIAGSTSGANGFDATQSGNPSLFTFDNTAQEWLPISDTDINTLTAGGAYRLMVRGDRSIDMNTNAPSPTNTILRTRGTLKIGSHTVSGINTTADAYNFVGNPYQSAVEIEDVLISSTNVNPNHYYVWDPKVGGTNGRGAYVTYTFATSSNNVSGSAVNEYVQPMQAFFVKTLANGAASITFNESNKYTTTNENVYRMNTTVPILKLNLFDAASLQAGDTALDGIMCLFGSQYADDLDAFDAGKLTNLDENLAVQVLNTSLSVAAFNAATQQTEYPLSLANYKHENYVFKAELQDYQGLTPYLFDNFTNTYTTIENGMTYNFSVNQSQSLSTASNRFKIVFTNQTLSIDELDLEKYINVYPNPASSGNFNLTLPAAIGDVKVTVYNELGQEIAFQKTKTTDNYNQYKAEHFLSYGVYHIVITTKEGTTLVKKWVVNN